jgi:serine/threonine protein kinase/Tol biopolymer transport system component
MMDRLGQQLGNYRLTRLLGQGGVAEVYQGEHVLLGTQAALKVLHAQVNQDEVKSFQQEARFLANLKHPHIIAVFDFGLAGQTPYLVMDYASHGSLRTRHARGRKVPLPTVIDYVTQVAEALQYAHDHNVVHRDVKPENMLIGEQGELLLSDFSVALLAQRSRQQSTQQIIGTAVYLSPEQIQGEPLSASDQYALGIVVYEWLSGTPPFHGSFTELCTQHLLASPPPLPALSPAVEQVVLTALAKDPARRFETVAAFATALQQASQGTLPTEYPPPADRSSISPALFPAASSAASPRHSPVGSPVTKTAPAYPATRVRALPARTTDTRAVPRRVVLMGGVVLAAVGGVFLFLRVRHVISPQQTGTKQKPTPVSQGQLFLTHRGHAGPVNAVAWSPDGQRIASGSGYPDNAVQVWNASDGSHLFTYRGHSDQVMSVGWSPDGQRIASCSIDGTAQVWSARDGRHLFTYRGHSSAVYTVAWSPDGQRIASCSGEKIAPSGVGIATDPVDTTVQVWSASDGSHLFTYRGHSLDVYTVAWSPDGQRIASGSQDNTVQVWNARDGSHSFIYQGHSNIVLSVAWSPDGQRIASSSFDHTVQVWNARDGSHIFTRSGRASAVTWAPNGQRIACGGDHTVQVWNATNGSHLFIYEGHATWVSAVAWAPDGQRIASGSGDKTVQVWQAV